MNRSLSPFTSSWNESLARLLDCYVEFLDLTEAVSAVNRFETKSMGGRGGRLGQRHVEVELSTQGALLKELFPKAKNVRWESLGPVIIERDPNDPYNSGFQGFVTKEELVMMIKHVETPQRVSDSSDSVAQLFADYKSLHSRRIVLSARLSA